MSENNTPLTIATASIRGKLMPNSQEIGNGGLVGTVYTFRKAKKGEEGDFVPQYFKFVAFSNSAKTLKGCPPKSLVTLDGRLQQEKYVDKSGAARESISLIVDSVIAEGAEPRTVVEDVKDDDDDLPF